MEGFAPVLFISPPHPQLNPFLPSLRHLSAKSPFFLFHFGLFVPLQNKSPPSLYSPFDRGASIEQNFWTLHPKSSAGLSSHRLRRRKIRYPLRNRPIDRPRRFHVLDFFALYTLDIEVRLRRRTRNKKPSSISLSSEILHNAGLRERPEPQGS